MSRDTITRETQFEQVTNCLEMKDLPSLVNKGFRMEYNFFTISEKFEKLC